MVSLQGPRVDLVLEIGSPLPRVGKARYERNVAAAYAALGDEAAFGRAWKEGRALTLQQALEIAVSRERLRGSYSTTMPPNWHCRTCTVGAAICDHSNLREVVGRRCMGL